MATAMGMTMPIPQPMAIITTCFHRRDDSIRFKTEPVINPPINPMMVTMIIASTESLKPQKPRMKRTRVQPNVIILICFHRMDGTLRFNAHAVINPAMNEPIMMPI